MLSASMNEAIFTVSEITGQIKLTLEENFAQVVVIGELSNFKAHYSGHWYFTLKDDKAQINCTMWKGVNSYVFFTPEDGMKVVVKGRLSVYPPRGSYQIDVRSMQPAGRGELQEAFERLKQRLAAEGLFDDELKKPLPSFPEKIGIVTPSDGAAFRDLVSVAERRFPLVELIIRPTKVQGEGAAKDIADAIAEFNNRSDIDLLIAGRGGGSLEDLWAFNEEEVARAIFDSHIPVISAVGHEIDYTISDFVADLRAPTPTAAMELATPNYVDIINFILEIDSNLYRALEDKLSHNRTLIESILSNYAFKIPENLIALNKQTLDNSVYQINSHLNFLLKENKNQLVLIDKILDSFDVNKTLKRGFSLVKQDDRIIRKSNELDKMKVFSIRFIDNEVKINE